MSHNKITVNNQNINSNSNIGLNVENILGSTPLNNQTIKGNASNEYEFGTSPTSLNPLTEYFFACNDTNYNNSQNVTSYGYITQFIDNRSGTNFNVESGIQSTSLGGDNVNYGGGSSEIHSQLLIDEGNYFCEYYPSPNWTTSSGHSVLQFVQGNSGSADVKGNRSYCYTSSPSRNFYARVKSSGANQRVWPKIIENSNQRIGAEYQHSQSMIAYKI